MTKRILVIFGVVVLLFSGICSSFSAYGDDGETTAAASLKIGDSFELGYYPQSHVTDRSIINELNEIDAKMIDYGYFQKDTGESCEMYYADIEYNGARYRKVYFEKYRIGGWPETIPQYQRGYYAGQTYYFKWEPLVWCVMTVGENEVVAYSPKVIEYQRYHSESTA